MSSGGANAELGRDRPDPGRLGRAVGIALFWLLLCYVIGMSALSIIPSLFWPELAPRPHAPGLNLCAHQIKVLDEELLTKSAEALRGSGPASLGRWLGHWDQRYLVLAGGCGPLEGARKDLFKLRTGIESLLRTYQSGAMKAQERIRRALEQVNVPAESVRPKS